MNLAAVRATAGAWSEDDRLLFRDAFRWRGQSVVALSAVEPNSAVFTRHVRHGGIDGRLLTS